MRLSLWLTLFSMPFNTFANPEPAFCKLEPQGEFIDLSAGRERFYRGDYMRVHPSGEFVIDTSGNSRIIDLRNRSRPRIIETRMAAEAFATEGTWRLVMAPEGSSEPPTEYFVFDDFIKKADADQSGGLTVDAKDVVPPTVTWVEKGTEVQKSFRDADFGEYYSTTAELPGSDDKVANVRLSLWNGTTASLRDYRVEFDGGRPTRVTPGPILNRCANLKLRFAGKPMLNKDGTELSLSEGGTTRIYRILENGDCELVEDLGFDTGKINFSYPEPGKKGKIVFNGSASFGENTSGRPSGSFDDATYVYDRDTKILSRISTPGTESGYGGFTRDGRILFSESVYDPETGKSKHGIRIVKPDEFRGMPMEGVPGHQDLSGCFSGTGDYYTVIRKMSEAWQGICKKVAGETQMIFLSLGRDRCREFVTSASFKSSDFGKATSLSETQLLALCERSESVAASAPARTGAQAQVPGKASAVQLITEKCMECHRTAQARRSPRGALQPFPDPITDEWVSANAARLKSGIHESATMKSIFQGQTYTPEERTTLETALGGALPSAQ